MLCLAVAHRANYCAWQWGVKRGWLCLIVGRGARFAVPDSGAQGELLCLTVGREARLVVLDSGAEGEVYLSYLLTKYYTLRYFVTAKLVDSDKYSSSNSAMRKYTHVCDARNSIVSESFSVVTVNKLLMLSDFFLNA